MISCKHIIIASLFLTVIVGPSCVSQRKLSYLPDVTEASADSVNKTYQVKHENEIVVGDQLSIFVNAMDPEAVQAFNLPVTHLQRLGSSTISTSGSTLQGYWVDPNGYINFPVLGMIHVEGLTTTQLRDTLTQMISVSVKNPIVNVGFLNAGITVLGEVKSPGRHSLSMQGATIFDALAAAGDVTIYGQKNKILLAREVNGKMEFMRLNLNDQSIYASPYYYVRQNDVIFVEPNSARTISSQNIPFYLSATTTLASLATTIISIVRMTK